MRFAEVFLRLGCSLVAWMIIYAYFLWLAVLRVTGCGPDGDEMFRLLLGMAPFAAICSVLLRMSRPLREIHSILRWLALPLALLFPLTLWSVADVFNRATLGASGLCNAESHTAWHAWWAPLQFTALAVVVWMVVRVWLSVAADRSRPASG